MTRAAEDWHGVMGPSPRRRGSRHAADAIKPLDGANGVHPRVGGAAYPERDAFIGTAGPSPRRRGSHIRENDEIRGLFEGSIPA